MQEISQILKSQWEIVWNVVKYKLETICNKMIITGSRLFYSEVEEFNQPHWEVNYKVYIFHKANKISCRNSQEL